MSGLDFGRRLGRITPAQLQQALNLFGLGQVQQARPIPFGLFGQNLMVTSDQGEFVLRGQPHFPWQFPTEQYVVDQLHAVTQVPVPAPYRYTEDRTIFGWPFVIMPKMPGVQLADAQVVQRLTAEDRQGIARAMGHNLAEMHRLTGPCSGRYDPQTNSVVPFDRPYGEWVVERLQTHLNSARQQNGHTTPDDVRWVNRLVDASRSALAVPFTPTLVMEDYKEGNVAVERAEGGTWRVSGVFDFMTAHFGDPEADLSRLVGEYARQQPAWARTFVETYLSHHAPRSGFEARFALYLLADALIIWEYVQREEGGMPGQRDLSLRAWAEPFMTAVL
ncbi:phosphotransferase family protein [Deinococcus oregonensis]|uniref:Phosphotransferase family protein n=1 Tax=Deinococcus oregonensis TaxID=1805970 RepID=A0ABV6AX38_9DEIO